MRVPVYINLIVRFRDGIWPDERPFFSVPEAWMKRYQEGSVCGSFDADIHTLINEQPPGHDLVTLSGTHTAPKPSIARRIWPHRASH